ncbi:3-oxoacyl-[acyl-carrier-protein] synthase III C-terminal domain-containing protein [Gilvibacter sp.]|uniref:type III polyketide synthase n=1 Tax=Gilvibacter sp. TaxID=2729997 RepID=UPI0025BC2DC1|nr:3-oxoacyl-[acyl-carrier-protein] synthase III C-terminal domain-containing protein [Gilvibacter sp.]NQX76597.1 type III polyketide synthase [Gilvibacter sp.]
MSVRITAVSKALPEFSRTTDEILPYVSKWLDGQEDRFKRKVLKIFEGAGVSRRYAIMDAPDVFNPTSFEEKNRLFVKAAIDLGTQSLQNALDKAGWKPEELDMLITVSCTGIMIPSLDAYLINALGLRQDVMRLPVTEMGCAAGVSGTIYAYNFLKSNPNKKAAVIAVESPTATFQHSDYSMANMVSAAIFGDGAACVLLSSAADEQGPEILGEGMYHFYNATHLMGFDLTNEGLQMILDPEVPNMIASHFGEIIHPFLAKHGSSIEALDHLIFHPGGRKIVQTVDELFGSLGKSIEDTRAVLDLYGNMSSATVLYVLERFMEKNNPAGTQGLMLSFGPGFSAQRLLLQW